MLNIAKARADHTSHALPLACGAAQSSPPHLSQRGPGRAGREPAVQSTCRCSQNVSARNRAPANAHERSAIYRESVVLASRARAAARACSCTTLTSVAWVEHMQSSQAHKCSHTRSHASQQGSNHSLHTPPQSLREADSHLRPSRTPAAAREGRGRRGDVIEDCRAHREVVIARSRSAFSILGCVTGARGR